MKIEGYCGICACCLNPIANGEEQQIRPNGRKFHASCIRNNFDNYYVKLERRLYSKSISTKNKGAELTAPYFIYSVYPIFRKNIYHYSDLLF